MDKTAIKNFAMQARNILRAMAEKEAGFYSVTGEGCAAPVQKGADFETYQTLAGTENTIYGSDVRRRASLKRAVETLGFEQVMEETAYTWFNRMIAIRFMEINDYLPTRVRVLSSEGGGLTPDIVTHFQEAELNLTPEELEKVQNAKDANKYDEAYRILFIKQCNELNDILPGLFERTDDYMELLLKVSYTGDSVIRLLVDTVAEEDFNVEAEGQIEIIGWMYQYYNAELKDDTFARLKKNIKITKERIPAATQLFTPEWIVRYMVENSLGRIWIDHLRGAGVNVDEKARAEEYGWKYYLPEADQEEEVAGQLAERRKSCKDMTPQDITCIDPCMGSGHILVYLFDVLMGIYRSEGYSDRDAVFDILEHNIFGLDIDRRAYQLSYFALMMKGRGYGGRRFFRGREGENGERVLASPHVYAIEESNEICREQLACYGAGLDELSKNHAISQMNGLLDALEDAKEYGSILNVENYDWELLRAFVAETGSDGQMTLDSMEAEATGKLAKKLVAIGEILAGNYDVVVTNPPYMGASNMNSKLAKFIKSNYADYKSDFFSVFFIRCSQMALPTGKLAFFSPYVWMFIQSYEKLRYFLCQKKTIETLIQFEYSAFEEATVPVCTFVFSNYHVNKRGCYFRLTDFRGGMEVQRQKTLEAIANHDCGYYYEQSTDIFSQIPGSPVAYWVSSRALDAFRVGIPLRDVSQPKTGMRTGDNDRFLRLWSEVDYCKIGFLLPDAQAAKMSEKKWFPYNKGGEFQLWYGNNSLVVNWENDGAEIKENTRKVYPQLGDNLGWKITNEKDYFKCGITWTALTSGRNSFRYSDLGFIFDSNKGPMLFGEKTLIYYLLGLLNSQVAIFYLNVINPSLSLQNGDIEKLPIIVENTKKKYVEEIVNCCINIVRIDWDSFETSWDFKRHPMIQAYIDNSRYQQEGLLCGRNPKLLKDCFVQWSTDCDLRFSTLKRNEEELNRIFIDIYGLQDELTPEVEDRDVTVRKADLQRDIRNLLSYAVGCMFGRYSLAEPGLIFAGGKFDGSRYGSFPADEDGIIPITDEEYFSDDIVCRFVEFVKTVYGEDTLEENLDFIAQALGNKGETSREIIRNYFMKSFYADHVKIYQKRPIYWLFDSGKQNGFKALIYLHRYTPDTVGLVRSVYLKKVSEALDASLKNALYIISEKASAVDVALATKKRDKYVKQLAEIKPYYQALSHMAMRRIPLDPDDGVKVNYAKFQGIEVAEEGGKRQTIDLLAKM